MVNWAIVGLFFASLSYVAIIILKEKKRALKDGNILYLGPFPIWSPPWWPLRPLGDTKAQAKWKDREITYELKEGDISPVEELLGGIELDDGPPVYQSTPHYRLWRVEGMGSVDGERRYLDAFCLQDKLSQKFLLARGPSPVLEGGLEGPYFEESLMFLLNSFSQKNCGPSARETT